MTEKSDTDEQSVGQEDLLEQAKQLLVLTDLVDRYPSVVSRRVAGLLYVLIGGAISLTALLFSTLVGFMGESMNSVFVIIPFIVLVLLLTYVIAFRLIIPLTKSFAKEKEDSMSTTAKVVWGFLSTMIVVTSIYAFGTGQEYFFPIGIQIILFIGNIGNYNEAKKDPNEAIFAKSQLIFSVIVLLSLIPIILVPPAAFSVMILVDIGGIYAMGIYMLLTAERLLIEVTSR
jgi:hypothetical protein